MRNNRLPERPLAKDEFPRVLRPDEVAKLLNCSRSQVYSLIKSGEISSIRVGRAVRVPEAAFASWLSVK